MSSRLTHLAETSLNVENLERSRQFYQRVFGLKVLLEEDRLVGLELPGSAVLMLSAGYGPKYPAQAGEISTHLSFSVAAHALQEWERHLMMNGVVIESRVMQADGGISLYFRDPDEHSLEVATSALSPQELSPVS